MGNQSRGSSRGPSKSLSVTKSSKSHRHHFKEFTINIWILILLKATTTIPLKNMSRAVISTNGALNYDMINLINLVNLMNLINLQTSTFTYYVSYHNSYHMSLCIAPPSGLYLKFISQVVKLHTNWYNEYLRHECHLLGLYLNATLMLSWFW